MCKILDISRKTFYEWMNKDLQLREIYVEAREATDDLVESQLLNNIKKGEQRAIEFYLTNRRSIKWRSRGLLQEPDSGETIDIQRLYREAVEVDITPTRASG